MATAKTTTDHDQIRRWVEAHGGHPATVKRTRSARDPGLIRVDFPGYSGEKSLEPIAWDDWFRKFDQQDLVFLYQDGPRTRFNKLVRHGSTEQKRRPAARAKQRTKAEAKSNARSRESGKSKRRRARSG